MKINSKFLTKIILTLAICLLPIQAFAFEGLVVGITDGDTIKVIDSDKNLYKIRLYGIDCPEKGQAFGKKAKQKASDLCYKKTVEIEEIDTDRYGRMVAIVHLDGDKTLSGEMIRSGYAWVYTKYCKLPVCSQWKAIEEQAKSSGLGLFADQNATPPWEWRRRK